MNIIYVFFVRLAPEERSYRLNLYS